MDRPRYALGSWLYLRLLGAVLLIAFVSFWVQAHGLVGERGIAPAGELIARLDRAGVGFFDHPTLAWLGAGNTALHAICAAGVVCALLVTLGVVTPYALFASWLLYLSVVNLGFPFTAFQWDTLLVEATFASIFLAPMRVIDRLRDTSEPEPLARWLLWALLFRFMFRSGVVKLMSGDPTWADLSALEHHYETQPLPSVLGWYAYQLPAWAQEASAALMFLTELVVPFLIFVPSRWARRTAAAGFTGLMLLIALTGNYCFFNLLAIGFCLTLLDDDLLRRLRLPFRGADVEPRPDPLPPLARRIPAGIALALGALVFLTGFGAGRSLTAWLDPFRTFNNYGLFAVMTTERPEIVVEGSRDGVVWEPYVFEYKPGPVDRRPLYNQPHQPRLDWQMWFAALGSHRQSPWLRRFMQRLLAGEPAVLDLIEHDPFPDEPPRYVRAVLYDYRFTTFEERERTGAWWHREERGLFAPVLARPAP